MALSPLNQRRWNNFRRNKRAFWSFWIFSVLFVLSLFAEFIANDKPILVSYRGELHMPIFKFYPETAFGGDFRTEAVYKDPEVECLIRSGGNLDCFDDPEGIMEQEAEYIETLMAASHFQIVDDLLEIKNEAGEIILIFQAK